MIYMKGQYIHQTELDLTYELNGVLSLQGHREIRLGNYDLGSGFTALTRYQVSLSYDKHLITVSTLIRKDGNVIGVDDEVIDVNEYDWIATFHEDIVEDTYDEDE